MARDPNVYIEDILESADIVKDYIKGVSVEEFLESVDIQDKVIRRLEIIGEATKGITDDLRSDYPDIPWKEISGLRDVLIHHYFGVNMERIWKVAKEDLPELEEKLKDIQI